MPITSDKLPPRIGPYRPLRCVGEGTTGRVFEAYDEGKKRAVAIKWLKNARHADDLLAEIRTLSAIRHANVVEIYGSGEHEGRPFVVMEWVGGSPQPSEWVASKKHTDDRLALKLAFETACGLHAAAKAGFVHGDVKPQNILLDAAGTAKVADFGLTEKARVIEDGKIWGTPHYVAPECVRGGVGDARSDIFSLGATLYHLLTGRPPFTGPTVKEIVAARLTGPPPDPRAAREDIRPEVAQLVMRMMARKPRERFADYDELCDEIQSVRARV